MFSDTRLMATSFSAEDNHFAAAGLGAAKRKKGTAQTTVAEPKIRKGNYMG